MRLPPSTLKGIEHSSWFNNSYSRYELIFSNFFISGGIFWLLFLLKKKVTEIKT